MLAVAAAPDAHLGLDVHYQLLAETDTYLSLDIYSSSAAGSSEDLHRYYTIEKPSGTLRTLSSFFHSDADYITPINDYLHQEMARQNAAEENFYWLDDDDIVSFTSITPDQAFYLDADGRIVICFAKYEIAPGSSGSPTFIIPEEVIAGLRTSDF
ncbi:MAG: RsiV family protein [Clostridia bacterium]